MQIFILKTSLIFIYISKEDLVFSFRYFRVHIDIVRRTVRSNRKSVLLYGQSWRNYYRITAKNIICQRLVQIVKEKSKHYDIHNNGISSVSLEVFGI